MIFSKIKLRFQNPIPVFYIKYTSMYNLVQIIPFPLFNWIWVFNDSLVDQTLIRPTFTVNILEQ